MIQQWLNGKTLLFIIAAAIVTGTIFYSSYLAKKIAADEKKKVEIWAEAQRTIINASDEVSLNLAAKISSENKEIPIIETNENDSINTGNCVNLDTVKIKSDPNYLYKKLDEFKKDHEPIILTLSEKPYTANKYYYGESTLQQRGPLLSDSAINNCRPFSYYNHHCATHFFHKHAKPGCGQVWQKKLHTN